MVNCYAAAQRQGRCFMAEQAKKFNLLKFFFSYEGTIGRLAYLGGLVTLNVLCLVITFLINKYCLGYPYWFFWGSFLLVGTVFWYSLLALMQKRCRSFEGNATWYIVVFVLMFGVKIVYDVFTNYGIENILLESVSALLAIGAIVAGLILLFSEEKENPDMSKRSVLLTYPLSFCLVVMVLVVSSQFIALEVLNEAEEPDSKTEVEDSVSNMGAGAGFVYRHVFGYKEFCHAHGYELTRYPEAFAEKFSEEIELLQKEMVRLGSTLDAFFADIRKQHGKTIEDSVYTELDGLRKDMILLHIALQKGIPAKDVQWSDEFEDSLSMADVCYFIDTKAGAFVPTEDNPGVRLLREAVDYARREQ